MSEGRRNASSGRARVSAGEAAGGVGKAGAGRAGARSVAVREVGRRTRFLRGLRELDTAWVESFHETGLSDVYFSRLFTELWLRGDMPVPKTDAYSYVKGVGVQTAMKYVKRAIDQGYLEELDNPADGRSRLIRMTPRLRTAFESVIDRAAAAFGL
ncbi:MAG: hypothetical protein WCJ69_09885 [Betaproteobacteria bacterium]